jgi:hypothetical protein
MDRGQACAARRAVVGQLAVRMMRGVRSRAKFKMRGLLNCALFCRCRAAAAHMLLGLARVRRGAAPPTECAWPP